MVMRSPEDLRALLGLCRTSWRPRLLPGQPFLRSDPLQAATCLGHDLPAEGWPWT